MINGTCDYNWLVVSAPLKNIMVPDIWTKINVPNNQPVNGNGDNNHWFKW